MPVATKSHRAPGVTSPGPSSTVLAARSTGVSVIVPVYRSQGTLRALYERLVAVLDCRGAAYEILFVEDGVPYVDYGDPTWERGHGDDYDRTDAAICAALAS